MDRTCMKECKVCDNLIPEKAPKNRVYCYECRPPKEPVEFEEITTEPEEQTDSSKDKKKDKTRPIISPEKQFFILKEQDYECRGPGPKDNEEYECDMKVNGKRFCDKKSTEPQYDHIIRWKEGGNGIENIQALCASCHLMKTSMENLINDDNNAIKCPRIKVIYDSLTKEKYKESTIDESSDESSEDELFIPRHPIIRTNTRVRRANRRYV